MEHPNNCVSPYSTADDSSSSSTWSVDPMLSGVSLQSILSFNPSLSLNLPSEETCEPPPLLEYLPISIPPSTSLQHYPFDFFPSPTQHYPPPPPSTFLPLPPLHSLESFPLKKRPRHLLIPDASTNFFLDSPSPSPSPSGGPIPIPIPIPIPQSHLARQRRQKLSDKTRCLQKLMPWDKKMDQATLLEEACKYVKFLQAQFNALQSMPSHSHSLSYSAHSNADVFGDLERLNRNQVLQVLVNSPVAQTRLYSQGFCVFSLEQLTLLTNFTPTGNGNGTGKTLLLPQYVSSHHN